MDLLIPFYAYSYKLKEAQDLKPVNTEGKPYKKLHTLTSHHPKIICSTCDKGAFAFNLLTT